MDIKPYIAYSDAIADAQSGYAREAPVLNQVVWSEIALSQRIQLTENGLGSSQLYQEIEQVLALTHVLPIKMILNGSMDYILQI